MIDQHQCRRGDMRIVEQDPGGNRLVAPLNGSRRIIAIAGTWRKWPKAIVKTVRRGDCVACRQGRDQRVRIFVSRRFRQRHLFYPFVAPFPDFKNIIFRNYLFYKIFISTSPSPARRQRRRARQRTPPGSFWSITTRSTTRPGSGSRMPCAAACWAAIRLQFSGSSTRKGDKARP